MVKKKEEKKERQNAVRPVRMRRHFWDSVVRLENISRALRFELQMLYMFVYACRHCLPQIGQQARLCGQLSSSRGSPFAHYRVWPRETGSAHPAMRQSARSTHPQTDGLTESSSSGVCSRVSLSSPSSRFPRRCLSTPPCTWYTTLEPKEPKSPKSL